MYEDRRIAFFHAYPHQYAGSQRITNMLARELPEGGWSCIVIVPDEGPFPQRLRADSIAVEVVRAPRPWTVYGGGLESARAIIALISLPAYWLRLARAFRRLRPTVVHANDHRGVLLAGVPARLARIPLVWHVHGAYGSAAINRLGVWAAARVVVVSRSTLAELPWLEQRPDKVEVLHNGIPRVDAPSEHRVTVRRPLIVTGARINPEKGLDVLLRAAALLRRQFPDLAVAIAGAPQRGYEEYRAELERLRDALGLADVVRMLGHVPDPIPLWASADVYVQPSRAEPFGLGVLEAMWLGVPVVATRVGGMAETIVDGVTGVHVCVDDPRGLAAALERVLSDPGYAASLAAAARRRVEERFSVGTMLDRLNDIYEEVSRR